MKQSKKNRGQGLVEYTLLLVLVALVFWVTMKNSGVGDAIKDQWVAVKSCLDAPINTAGCK